MKTLLIIYHSITGGSKSMAQALADGADTEKDTETGIQTLLLHASEATEQHVLQADGVVFITPETLGSMAGLMKDFLTAPTTPCWTTSRAGLMPCWCVQAVTGMAQ